MTYQKTILDTFTTKINTLQDGADASAYCQAYETFLGKTDIQIDEKSTLYAAIDNYNGLSDQARTEVLTSYPAIVQTLDNLETVLYKKMMLAGDITSDSRFASKAFVIPDSARTINKAAKAEGNAVTTAVTDEITPMVLNSKYLSGLSLQKVSFEMNYSDINTLWGNTSDSIYLYYLENAYKSIYQWAGIWTDGVSKTGIQISQGDFSGSVSKLPNFTTDMKLRYEITYDYSRSTGSSIGFIVDIYNATTNELIGTSNTYYGASFTNRANTVFGVSTAITEAATSTYSNVKISWSAATFAGASVLATETMADQDLRFGMSLNDTKYLPTGANITEYGIIYMLDHWLEGRELTKETVGKNGYTPYVSSVTVSDVTTLPSVYTERMSNSMKDEFMGLKVVGRGYIVYELNGTKYTIYTDATSKHSVVSAIKAVASKISKNTTFTTAVPSTTAINYGGTTACTVADVESVINGNENYTSDQRKQILLTFIKTYCNYSK